MSDVWGEVDTFLERHRQRFNLSVGLEYSSVIDWVCEFVPRRNHPKARDYNGPWRVQRANRDDAVRDAMVKCESMLTSGAEPGRK